jgi:hypothetical protein
MLCTLTNIQPACSFLRQTVQKLKHIRIGIGEKIEIAKCEEVKMSFCTDSR